MEIYVSRTVPPAGPRQKEVFARVDTGRCQMEGRIMLPAGWWKCDCELLTLCKSDKRHDILVRTHRIQSPIRRLYLLIWIGVSTTAVSGVWSYCNRTKAMFFVRSGKVFGSCQTLYKLWWMLLQLNVFKLIHWAPIDGWPAWENTRVENIIIT